jgi:hypothetical protein
VPKARPCEFGVNHYAGRVVYNVESFMEKNKDELLLNIQNLLETSRVPFIKSLFSGGGGGAEAKVMQGQQFRNQLDDLMKTLNATDPGYIRCVKSNSAKKSGIYESSICLQQLRYAGVFEAVRVRQLGFPFRFKHAIFYMRYRCICYNLFFLGDASYDAKFLAKLPAGGLQSDFPFKKACNDLLVYIAANISPERISPVDKVFKFGKTMMLYRADQSRRLDALRQKAHEHAALEIQRVFRAHRVRKIARRMRAQRETMRAAIRARDLAAVRSANAEAKKLPFRLAEMRVLDPLEKFLAKEEKLVADLTALLPLEPAEHAAAYEKALADGKTLADQAKVDAKVFEGSLALGGYSKVDAEKLPTALPAYKELERKFASVEQRKKAKEELEATIARGDIASIQEALRKAGEAGDDLVSSADRQRAAEAIAAMERDAEVLKKITTAVATGRVSGHLGNLLAGTIRVDGLEAVELGIRGGTYASSTPRFQTLSATVTCMLALRKTLKRALEASSSAAWREVEAEVRKANALKADGRLAREADEEVAAVEAEVRDRGVQESLKDGIARGAATGALGAMALKSAAPGAVEEAVKAATALKSGGLGLSFAAEQLLVAATRVWRLREAQSREDWKAIGTVIEEAFNPAQDKVTLLPLAVAEFNAARDELNNHNIIRELERELANGFATGSAGVLNTDAITLPEKSIKLATELGPKTAQAQALLRCAQCVLAVRRALRSADGDHAGAAEGKAILAAVEATRADVPREFMPAFTHDQELVVAEAHGRNLLLMATLRDALVTGCPSGAVGRSSLPPITPANNKIAEALALCKQVRVKNGEAQQLERAVTALKEVREAFVRKEWVALGNAVEHMKSLEGCRYSVRAANVGEDAGVVIKSKPAIPARTGMAGLLAAAAEDRAARTGGGGGGGGGGAEEEGSQWTGARKALISTVGKKRLSDAKEHAAAAGGDEGMALFHLPPESHAELSLLEDEVNNYKLCTSLLKALGAGCAGGSLGALSIAAIETDALSFALKKNQLQLAKFLKTPLAAALYYTGSVVRDLRSSIKEGDWVSVENTLKSVSANNFRVLKASGKPVPSPAEADAAGFGARERAASTATRERASSTAMSPGVGLGSPRGDPGGHVPTSVMNPPEVSPHAEIADLAGALEMAKITLVQPGFTEVVRVEAEAAYRRVIEGMLRALDSGGASGAVGALNVATLDVAALAAQIDAARALGARTPRAQQLSVLCRLMWQVRTAVGEDDWAAVESLLIAGAPLVAAAAAAAPSAPGAADAAPLGGGIHRELKLYGDEASNRRVMAQLRAAILTGGPVGSVGKLVLSSLDTKALEEAVRVGLASGTVTAEASQLLASAVHLRALRLCLEGGSWARLGELLDYAASSRAVAKAYSMSTAAAAAGKAGGGLAAGGAALLNTADGKGSMGYWPGVVGPEAGLDLAATGVAPELEAELALLQRELTNRTVIARLVAALGVGAPRGDVGHLDCSELSTVELDRALDFALAAGVATTEAEMLVATAQLARRTRQALGHGNWGALEEALNGARGKLLAEAGMQEVQRAQWELDDRLQREEMVSALGKGRPQGRVGRLFIAAIDVKPLNAAVALATRLGPRSPEAVQLLFTGKVVARLRGCLMADNIAEAAVTLDAVAGKLLHGAAMPEVLAVKEEVENWKVVSLLSAAIQAGAPTGVPGAIDLSHVDTSGLERALSQADEFGVKTAEAQTLYATSSLLVRLRRALLDGLWGATTDALQAETAAAVAAAAGGGGSGGGEGGAEALSLAALRAPEEEGGAAALRDTVERLLTEASASALPLSDLALPELVLLRSEVANQRAVLTFSLVLSRGGATGAPGALDVSRVDLSELDAALADVAAMGVHTENAARLMDAARLIRRLRSTLLSGNWKWVGSVLLDARAMRTVLPHKCLRELQVAQDELDNRALLAQVGGALAEGAVGGPVGKLDTASISTAALDDAISFARTLGVKSTEAATALATAMLVRRVRAALRTGDYAGAREALEAAAGKPRAPAAEAELTLVSTSVDNWVVTTALRHACAGGAPTGPLLSPDPGSILTEPLDAAIATTMRLGVHSGEARVALCSALVARRLRAAAADGDYGLMEVVVAEAAEQPELLPSVAPEVARAKAALRFKGLLEALAAAGARRDAEALEAGLEAVRALNMAAAPTGAAAAAVAEAAALLDAIRVCLRDLAAGAAAHSIPGLAEALAHARALSLARPEVEEGARALAKLEALTAAAAAALASMDATAMAAALRAADAERVNLPPVPALRDALALPRPQFLRRELDAVLEALASASPSRETAVIAPVERGAGEGGGGAGGSPARAPPPSMAERPAPDEPAYVRRAPTPAELRVINATVAIKDCIFADLPPTDDVISSALAASAAAGFARGLTPGGAPPPLPAYPTAPSGTAAAAEAAAARLNETLARHPSAAPAIARLRAQRHMDENAQGALLRVTMSVLRTSSRPLFPGRGGAGLKFSPAGYRDAAAPATRLPSPHPGFATEPAPGGGLGEVTPPASSLLRRTYGLHFFRALKPPHMLSSRFASTVGIAESRMLCWQHEPLATSLTLLASADARLLAVRAFRGILAFMGDRPLSQPLAAGADVLGIASARPDVRDEVYVQLMKQLTEPASAAAAERGWVLLYAMITAVPPSEEFENYLELWLREAGATPCVWALHLTLYRNGPGAEGVPGAGELLALLEKAKAPVLPTLSQLSALGDAEEGSVWREEDRLSAAAPQRNNAALEALQTGALSGAAASNLFLRIGAVNAAVLAAQTGRAAGAEMSEHEEHALQSEFLRTLAAGPAAAAAAPRQPPAARAAGAAASAYLAAPEFAGAEAVDARTADLERMLEKVAALINRP